MPFSKRDKVGCEASPPLSAQRIASHQHLVDRILGQPRRVVAVGVPASYLKYPLLPDQIVQRVHNLARLTIVPKATAESRSLRPTRRRPAL